MEGEGESSNTRIHQTSQVSYATRTVRYPGAREGERQSVRSHSGIIGSHSGVGSYSEVGEYRFINKTFTKTMPNRPSKNSFGGIQFSEGNFLMRVRIEDEITAAS